MAISDSIVRLTSCLVYLNVVEWKWASSRTLSWAEMFSCSCSPSARPSPLHFTRMLTHCSWAECVLESQSRLSREAQCSDDSLFPFFLLGFPAYRSRNILKWGILKISPENKLDKPMDGSSWFVRNKIEWLLGIGLLVRGQQLLCIFAKAASDEDKPEL